MIINKDVKKHIRAVESKLFEELQIDTNDQSAPYYKLLNVDRCSDILSDCVLSKYCISIYKKYIMPMYFYIEYANNYLTVEKIASDYSLPACNMEQLINTGKTILNTINS